MIKKTTGFNFKELLQRKRLSKAVELMCDTDLPISDIIAAVGYENNSYFHRVFKVRYGVTPRAFRVANKKNDKVRLWRTRKNMFTKKLSFVQKYFLNYI